MKKLIYVTPRFPWPLITGDRIRCYNLLRALSKNFEITLIVLNNKIPEETGNVNEFCNVVHVCPKPQIRNHILHFIIGMARGWSLQECLFYRPSFHRLVSEEVFDLCIIHLLRSHGNKKFINSKIYALDMCDPVSLTYDQIKTTAKLTDPWKYISYFEAWRTRVNQIKILPEYRKVFLHTNADINKAELKSLNVVKSTMGLPIENLQPYFERSKLQKNLIFIGNLDYFPNNSGLQWFLEDVFPNLPAEYVIRIVGAGGASLRSRYVDPRIIFTGRVESIKPFLRVSGVGIAPMFVASGIQNKVLEYIYSGLNVVSTTVVRGALEDTYCDNVLALEKCPISWVKHLVDLHYAPSAAKRASQAVSREHDWGEIERKFLTDLSNG